MGLGGALRKGQKEDRRDQRELGNNGEVASEVAPFGPVAAPSSP